MRDDHLYVPDHPSPGCLADLGRHVRQGGLEAGLDLVKRRVLAEVIAFNENPDFLNVSYDQCMCTRMRQWRRARPSRWPSTS